MPNEKYLRLLAKDFPNIPSIWGEMIRLQALGDLPKGTEYFFSDLHGEDGAFIHMLRSASGTIRSKIHQLYDDTLSEGEQNQLANLVYDPEKVLKIVRDTGRGDEEWVRVTIGRLTELCRHVSVKYRRGWVEEKMPPEYRIVLRELIFTDTSDPAKRDYCTKITAHIARSEMRWAFIDELCAMIQRISVNRLHIIGDIFDRGSGPHKIMEELIRFGEVDFQWGNHDVHWMGAAAGSQVAMCSVLRAGISYNTFDALEHGYGFNLRALSTFAQEVYGDDPCERFRPKIYDENVFDRVDPDLSSRMHKAIAVIMFKLESQLLDRHPEYAMEHRNVLHRTDFRRMVLRDGDREYPLLDTNFPTIDPDDPARLTPAEEELMVVIEASFRQSEPLHRHVAFLYANGAPYTCVNGNLLFHGCVPLTEDGRFASIDFAGTSYAGKDLLDYVGRQMTDAYYKPRDGESHQDAVDFTWYVWCGPMSPMFGKSQMSTFENYFIEDKAVRKEHYNPYFVLSEQEEVCEMILAEFGLPTDTGHIVNGHVPVKLKQGETPVKGNGKLFVIDGGISKAYQSRTGIAGYTLIYNSHHLALAEHHTFSPVEDDMGSYAPTMHVIETMPTRVLNADTDWGVELRRAHADLADLLEAYKDGTIKEDWRG